MLTVIETRFGVNVGGSHKITELWSKYFCPDVDGQPTKEYVTSVVLPRTRDIVYFCNVALGRALDRRHERVEAEDFRAAEETYSQYAYEALLVDNDVTIPEMEDALPGFLDAPAIITKREINTRLSLTGLPCERHEEIIDKLIMISFIGLETKPGVFSFPEVGSDIKRAYAQANKLVSSTEVQRYSIYKAFHSFLGIRS